MRAMQVRHSTARLWTETDPLKLEHGIISLQETVETTRQINK
jgi:hypothetical protein